MLLFGRCELDLTSGELLRDGARVALSPQGRALLRHLATHAGRTVPKDELVASVWQHQPTTDEAIARAIMKLRRAMGDDAEHPQHLFTEAGQGYRFEPDPPFAQRPWRLLPFVNRSGDPGLDWVSTGLQRLLSHLMRSASPGLPVGCEATNGPSGSDGGELLDRTLRACSAHPRDLVCAADVTETADGFHLDMAWGVSGGTPGQMHLAGEHLSDLVVQAARHLAPQAEWQQALSRNHPAAYARLAEAVAQLHRGSRQAAAERLAMCVARLPPSAPLQLFHARLLIDLELYPQAERVARDTLSDLAAGPCRSDGLQMEALALVMLATTRLGRHAETAVHAQAAIALAEAQPSHAADAVHLPLVWRLTASVQREFGQLDQAAHSLERSVAAALRTGQWDQALNSRILLVYMHLWLGDADRAAQVARQALEQAEAEGSNDSKAGALRAMSVVAKSRGHLPQAVRWAERSLAQSVGGAASSRLNAYSALIEALLDDGQLERVDQVLRMHAAQGFQGEMARLGPQEHRAQWLWRMGRLQDSEAAYRQLIAALDLGQWSIWANHLLTQLACLQALLGRPEDAQGSLQQLPSVVHPVLVAHAQAAVHMAQGQRARAKAVLQGIAAQCRPGIVQGPKALLDLAWLCLEDQAWEQVDDLLTALSQLEDDGLLLRWVQRVRQAQLGEVPPEDWQDLRQRSGALLRHAPRLGTAEDLNERRQGRAPRLSNLLSVLAY